MCFRLKFFMIKRSLILNFLYFVRTLNSTASDILALCMMWFVIRWICLEAKFDFISATLGFLIGISLLVSSALIRAIKFKYIGLLISRFIIIFTFVIFGNNIYQMLTRIKSDETSMSNVFVVLLVISIIIMIIGKILDRVLVAMVNRAFERHEDDFELVEKSVVYHMGGGAHYESYKYRLKSMNFYNIEFSNITVMD